ncbi:MAG: hypothetical protein H7Y88_00560, partial [Phycisphaerales bacterium]|nr:hypothetical protein [Phycisphaerales bacterium]
MPFACSLEKLKAVINSEQIEYFAMAAALSGELAAATYLRGSTAIDSDPLFTETGAPAPTRVFDLASKIVSYDTSDRVEKQYLQTGCGCSGPSQGIRLDYAYAPGTLTNHSIKITENYFSGGTYTAYR